MTGWYPDPGGRPDRYRYWNGESWSEQTSTDPADPPPGAPGRARHPTAKGNRHYGVAVFGLAALVLVLVVVSTALIIHRAADPDPIGQAGDTGPSSSSWDDSSPLPRAGTPGADSTAAGSDRRPTCPIGEPAELAPHQVDGRVHGGRLSMATIQGYSAPGPEYMLSWMSDTEGINQTTEPGWQSIFAVGELQRTTDFASVRDAAHSSMNCAMHTGWYLHLTGHKPVRDQPIRIDGHQGWILTWNVYDATPTLKVPGDQLTFVAVDDGRSDAYSMWCGMVPIGDTQRMALDARVLAGLRVSD